MHVAEVHVCMRRAGACAARGVSNYLERARSIVATAYNNAPEVARIFRAFSYTVGKMLYEVMAQIE